jgi:predicted AlkP superfamily phosphohydrolase/phosphomutase
MHKFENSLLYATDPDLDIEGSNLYDVTPTILDLMDVERDADFDGDSLLNA